MLFLWIFGDNVEDYLGHFNYLVFYFICGIAGGLTHILLNLNSSMPTIGASGAIAGVMGAYFILYPKARVLTWFFVFILWLPAWLVLGYWFALQFLMTSQYANSGVAVWAHLGGFAVGVLLVKLFPERQHRQRYGTW
jgi:membrane associated rhomboid family serine protease